VYGEKPFGNIALVWPYKSREKKKSMKKASNSKTNLMWKINEQR